MKNSTPRWRLMIARRRAKGVCVTCKEPLEEGRTTWRCAECIKANRPAARRWYHAGKAQGLCPSCRKPYRDPEYVCCPACRQKAKERFALRDATVERKRRGPYESKKLAALDAALAKTCGVCGLRGEHVCTTATRYATARRAT